MASIEQHKKITDGATAAAMLPHIEAEVEAMKKSVVTRAIQRLKNGELTPDLALEAWREYATAIRLLKNFQTRVTIGNSVAEEVGPDFDLS